MAKMARGHPETLLAKECYEQNLGLMIDQAVCEKVITILFLLKKSVIEL